MNADTIALRREARRVDESGHSIGMSEFWGAFLGPALQDRVERAMGYWGHPDPTVCADGANPSIFTRDEAVLFYLFCAAAAEAGDL